jgi:SNF2 family DNA or RNA helicase
MEPAYKRARTDIKGRLDGHYQHEGVKWMLQREFTQDNKGGILADDMGLGKTMQTIATMRGNPKKTLIVSIVSTVAQWRDALIDFGGYRPVILNPSFQASLPQDVDTVITTYSVFQKPKSPAFKAVQETQWERIILDEGHLIRNTATKIYQSISQLQSDIKWILSGTPIQNSKKDLITLIKWIAPSLTLTLTLDEMVSQYVLRRTQEEQAQQNPRLALPQLETSIVRLKFATQEEQDFYDSIETKEKDTLEYIMRCRQACVHSGTKFAFIIKDIQKYPKEKCLIFASWTNEIKMLQQSLKENNISALIYDGKLSRDNKEAALYNFKNTTIQVLILQIDCGSTGLNLQCASRIYITSPQWNPCVELQAIGRAYRKGQTAIVKVFRICIEDTIEDHCSDIQGNKVATIASVMGDDSMLLRLGAASPATPAPLA